MSQIDCYIYVEISKTMADNYLERRYEEVFGNAVRSGSGFSLPVKPSLDRLLLRNRSFRGYDKSYVVHLRQLETIISVNPKLASGKNGQHLRFRPVLKGPDAELVLRNISMGAALKDCRLPVPGTEPEAFIIACSNVPETSTIDIDLGISLQSMLLKAVEIGLGGLILRCFDADAIKNGLGLPLQPLAVLAIGKPAEKIELVPVSEGSDLSYYRQDGIHYVPKITDLII